MWPHATHYGAVYFVLRPAVAYPVFSHTALWPVEL